MSASILAGGDWAQARADRLALLVDAQAYFSAAEAALKAAERSILLIGWHFDSRTRLAPMQPGSQPIGRLLNRLKKEKPELQVRVLIWNMAWMMSAGFEFYPQRAAADFKLTGVDFRLDTAPFGASHHQKMLIIDDHLAFIGGGDLSVDRFDTARHLDEDPRRMDPDGDLHPPRHEVMALVDGPIAHTIADVARERWRRATGERLVACPPSAADLWPETLPAAVEAMPAALVLTERPTHGRGAVRQSESLHLEAIAAARHTIYLENQYFTSRVIGEALVARLEEPDGPEILVISTGQAPSWFDHATMDRARDVLLRRLQAADAHGRLSVWTPTTPGGRWIIVHSKVTVIDDRLLRVGSTNLNNRSMGFDGEADLAVEAETQSHREGVRWARDRLIAHFIGCTGAAFSEAVNRTGTLRGAVEAMNEHGRLVRLEPQSHGPWGTLVAEWQLGDPLGPEDSFRPWTRRRKAAARAEEARRLVLDRVRQLEVHPQGQVVGGDAEQRPVGDLDLAHPNAGADEGVVDPQDGRA